MFRMEVGVGLLSKSCITFRIQRWRPMAMPQCSMLLVAGLSYINFPTSIVNTMKDQTNSSLWFMIPLLQHASPY